MVAAEELRIFAPQKVIIADIIDCNDPKIDETTKIFILSSLKDAFVYSDNYQVLDIDIVDIRHQLISKKKQITLQNICKEIGKRADYILSTEVQLSTTDFREKAENVELIFTSSLYKISTATKVLTEEVKAVGTKESIISATSELISKLLKEKKSNSKNYSNNQSYGYGQQQTLGTINGHEYVDLGLSVKWATCNVGATTPEEYGDYFMWGETLPKEYYDWNTYKHCNNTCDSIKKYSTSSKYGIVDNKTILEIPDDVATVNWGGTWRMPTKSELDELIDTYNCIWEWFSLNEVKGYKVTSKKNGNSIFLPAAGYRSKDAIYDVGNNGYYWLCSLNRGYSCNAYSLLFYSDFMYWGSRSRCFAQSIRPVSK